MPPNRLSRQESRARTRQRLLDAAGELFAERGVNGTSVEQIAEHAGYSRGAFYGNFTDKQALVAELLKHRTLREREEVAALQRDATDEQDVLEPLRAWHRDRAEHLTGWLTLRLELLLYALRNPEIRPEVAERETIAREAIAGGVRHELGDDAPADADFLALILHALEDGLLIQRLLHPDRISDEVVVDAAELLLRSWKRPG
ncbi:TetR/AcrR family transcriptional regulator [Saccharopolyspora taberi]